MKTRRINKTGKKRTPRVFDQEKEDQFKQLCSELQAAGFEVRREELKSGFGWKVVSGSCRAQEQRLIFVDRRLTQQEQIDFLKNKLAEVAAWRSWIQF